MNAHDEEERVKRLLQQALRPIDPEQGSEGDMWPRILRRLDARSTKPMSGWAWFDIALLAGLVGVAALFPAAIPVLLYYL
jgi:hypothetical protein